MRLLIVLLLAGCSSLTPLEKEERDYDRAIDAEKWFECKKIYRDIGKPTFSRHRHQKGRTHRPDEVKEDLWDNNCGPILKRIGWD